MSDERRAEPARRKAEAELEQGKQRAREAAAEVKAETEARIEAGSRRAAASIGDVAEAVGSAAASLGDSEHGSLAGYAEELSTRLDGMSRRLKDGNVDDLVADVSNMARRNPALFVLGSVAIGIGLSRFAKASRRGAGDDRGRSPGAAETEWEQPPGDSRRAGAAMTERDADERRMAPDPTRGGGL